MWENHFYYTNLSRSMQFERGCYLITGMPATNLQHERAG